MVTPHHWSECRPATLKLAGGTPARPGDAEIMQAAIKVAWSKLTPAERENFHRFCCLNVKDLPAIATITRFQRLIQSQVPTRLR